MDVKAQSSWRAAKKGNWKRKTQEQERYTTKLIQTDSQSFRPSSTAAAAS